MSQRFARSHRLRQATAVVALVAMNLAPVTPTGTPAAAAEGPKTTTPIKHLIVIIGENRTFDNVYGTYEPQHPDTVSNLLSKGIVNRDGSPGPNKDLAKQFQIGTISPVSYFISTDKLLIPNKTAYAPFLPTPEAGGAPPRPVTLQQLDKDPVPSAPPFDASTFSTDQLHTLSPALEREDVHLLTTGATGLSNCTTDG